jgi:hypothetical protein
VLASAKPDPKPKPPKPKPQVELLSDTQAGALEKRLVTVSVESRRGSDAKVWATLTIDGAPAADYVFELGGKSTGLRKGKAKVRYRLNAREQEVLEFASLTCRDAKVDMRTKVKVGKRTGTDAETSHLKRPDDCRPG